MSIDNYRYIAMIPARLGSKRIPKKNIRYMAGKPLIQYSIELVLQSNRFESLWVNTESEELGKAAEKLGAQFHRRPDTLASDSATNRDFTYEFLQRHACDYVIMVNTTSPLLRQSTMERFLDYIEGNDYDTVLSVVAEKEETFFQGKPLNFSFSEKINSQLLEPTEAVVWALTAWKRATFMEMQEKGLNPVFGGKVGKFAIPKDEACDLDTEEDWNIAEGILMSRRNKPERRYMEL
ncbi:acylneuraminate cytidylyltransferase family protein [Schaedlerella arabinosiphila]|jgi:CMP-N-acetylneuraminic acid synthetase|uniref:Acylneuraminate cytidylyltransferase family protein n=1 Tax=Schaedlerella arabinosiphila TaxID=2044587 RepID=A0A426DLV0_9FIRM|nr:acylneuraminate cytidylyltransferase family protein [Schaedlerella arabinosiphila]RRK33739.1 acylneuraminate cytidylyltransferase family protein [Schaedlerella arabinosiphila]